VPGVFCRGVRLVLLRGTVFSHSPRPGQSILMLLDAIQPAGIFAGITPVIPTRQTVVPFMQSNTGSMSANGFRFLVSRN